MKTTIAAFVVCLSVYLPPIWQAQPVYEDAEIIADARPQFGGARFVTNTTLWLAPAPVAARAVNLGLHLVAAALVGVLMLRLGWSWQPVAVALLLLHAMSTETVMYLSGRGELVAAIGVLLSCCAAAGAWWRPSSLALLAIGIVLALGGKESGVLVFLLVPFTIWHRQQVEGRPRWATPWLPAGLCAAVLLGGIAWYGDLRVLVNIEGTLGLIDPRALLWSDWLLLQGGAVAYWLAALVWPPLLTPDPDIDRLSVVIRCVGLLAVCGCGALAWRCRSYGAGVFALAVLPRLIVQTPGGYLNAHQFYLPWVGLVLMVASWLAVRKRTAAAS